MTIFEALRAEGARQAAHRRAGRRVPWRDTVWARACGLAVSGGGGALIGVGLWAARAGWISIHFFAGGLLALLLGGAQIFSGAAAFPRSRGDVNAPPGEQPQ